MFDETLLIFLEQKTIKDKQFPTKPKIHITGCRYVVSHCAKENKNAGMLVTVSGGSYVVVLRVISSDVTCLSGTHE
jgi:hypothetical protein